MNAGEADRIQSALTLARELQERAVALQTSAERRQQAELDRMLQTPSDKATLVQLTDQAFRAKSSARIADQFTHILDVQGVPRFFSPLDRAMLHGFQAFGGWLPGVAVPLVKSHMQHETANVILPAEPELLGDHLRQRSEQGLRMNVNFLGEAILSEAEVERRMEQYFHALRLAGTEVFSVKISTLYSQMSPLAREHTIATVCDRLEQLYRRAARETFIRADGVPVPKFIYLDMEEYRDLSLTCEVFMRTLSRGGLENVAAGIALQAYIPDSARWQRAINDWARQRVAAGGACVTIRLVKGANMEMERFEAAVKAWPQAPFKTKLETDANYKRMLQEGLLPANLAAVRLGVASHNLFDVAYALVCAIEAGALDRVQFEMLEGMANHQRRALFERVSNLLLYAPVCRKEHFLSAIGYLIRRLDENTGPENFLRHTFRLTTGSTEWRELEKGFVSSFDLLPTLSDAPRRTQDRRQAPPIPSRTDHSFTNEPDTDWSLPHHAEWAQTIISQQTWTESTIPLVIDGERLTTTSSSRREEALTNQTTPDYLPHEALPSPVSFGGANPSAALSTKKASLLTSAATDTRSRKEKDCLDPSRPGVALARWTLASQDDVERAVASAAKDEDGWRELSYSARKSVLQKVAQELRTARAKLMWAALANTGKTLMESDPEVSEAIDFVEFYAESARWFAEDMSPHVTAKGRGVVVVVPPWNFPIAIPCGGIAAALAAGNTVILKPASDAVLVAWELCQCFWRGGISQRALQFVPCSGGEEGSELVQHPQVDAVILTGGTETALTMLRAKPGLRLSAETGGKNATIVTALADRDQAIKNVLHSAFSHGGQKCSATSLLLLEAEVHDDPDFKRALVEAAQSLIVGSAWDVKTKIGPLIRPPSGELQQALLTLEPGESWALVPRNLEGNPHLWSPGIKWGVSPGSVTHMTEFFGPVLGVMRFERLSEAITLVNQTGFGLTSGLESLDDREQAEWKAGIRAGNLYINRGTTGAIVLRQPFGGMGKSAFGPALKAGGPSYVAQFMQFEEKNVPEVSEEALKSTVLEQWTHWADRQRDQEPHDRSRLLAAFTSYDRWWREEFSAQHDHFLLPGQDNIRRYLGARTVRVRLSTEDSWFELIARVAAASLTADQVIVSADPSLGNQVLWRWQDLSGDCDTGVQFITETDAQLAQAIATHQCDRLRYASSSRVPEAVRRAANEANVFIADAPVLAEGRIELLWYLREQSISADYHRYGNLGVRADEARGEPR